MDVHGSEAAYSENQQNVAPDAQVSLATIALVFLKLGTIAFGGPAAHIAMMEDEFVTRRRWLTREQFLDRLGAASLIPGPSSTEMAIFIGYEMRGWRGLLVAGCCFILPAAFIVILLARAYVRYGTLPKVNGVLYAVKPVVIAVVIQAFWKLAHTAIKTPWLGFITAVALVFYGFTHHELLTLALSAALAAVPAMHRHSLRGTRLPLLLLARIPAVAPAMAAPVGLWRLFLVFAKTGAVLFGSGYVLLAFLRTDLVNRLHLLTEKQLLDSIAVGQVTPGPVFTTATFIGYIVRGLPGAAVATIGIFLPAFFFVALSGMLVPRIRKSPLAAALLDGVVVGSLALMGIVAWQLGRQAIIDLPSLAIVLVSAVLLLVFRINSAWLVAAAAAFGWFYGR